MNKIDFLYYIFPLFTLIFSIFEFKKKDLKNTSIFCIVFLIVFLAMSKIGADYENYRWIYNAIKSGIPLEYVHSEIGFKKMIQVFISLNVEYELFKSIYLGVLLIFLGFYLDRLSSNTNYSYFLLYSFYIVYLCSAYRQLFVFVITLMSFYYFHKRNKNIPLILCSIGVFIHISSIFSLLYFVYLKYKNKKFALNDKKLKLILLFSFFMRLILIKSGPLLSFLARIVDKESYFEKGNQILSFGLLSRAVVCFIILININKIKKNKLIRSCFLFYYVGTILYIIFPFDLVLGRLTNNSKLLEIIILPYVIKKQSLTEKSIVIFWIITLIAIAIFTNQLLKQGGYYPYQNLYF